MANENGTGNKYHGKPSNRWAIIRPTYIQYLYGYYSNKQEVKEWLWDNEEAYKAAGSPTIRKLSVREWHAVDGLV